jgi:hypothetical protein
MWTSFLARSEFFDQIGRNYHPLNDSKENRSQLSNKSYQFFIFELKRLWIRIFDDPLYMEEYPYIPLNPNFANP